MASGSSPGTSLRVFPKSLGEAEVVAAHEPTRGLRTYEEALRPSRSRSDGGDRREGIPPEPRGRSELHTNYIKLRCLLLPHAFGLK